MKQPLPNLPASRVIDLPLESNDAKLIVDKVYQGGRAGNAGDDPLSKLLGVSNQGGFRYLGKPDKLKLVVVTSNFNEPDWPDHFDLEAGFLTYFGDRREPGELHGTPRLGNEVLRQMFANLNDALVASRYQTGLPAFMFAGEGADAPGGEFHSLKGNINDF